MSCDKFQLSPTLYYLIKLEFNRHESMINKVVDKASTIKYKDL